MTTRQPLAGSALVLGLAVASAAAAHGANSFICQTFSMAKDAPPTKHCVTWSREAIAAMQAAPYDRPR